MNRIVVCVFAIAASVLLAPLTASAEEALLITPLVETKVTELPPGKLFWRIENFPDVAAARKAAGKWALVTQAEGKVWLFTLGPAGGSSKGGVKIAEVGPIPRPSAARYLLRINEATGPRGSLTPVHTHAGSEAFFVLDGEQSIRTAHGVQVVKARQPEPGHGAGMAMQVSSSGEKHLKSLVMFVVDASKPFSSPATFEPMKMH